MRESGPSYRQDDKASEALVWRFLIVEEKCTVKKEICHRHNILYAINGLPLYRVSMFRLLCKLDKVGKRTNDDWLFDCRYIGKLC